MTIDLDDSAYPYSESATTARSLTSGRPLLMRTPRGRVLCREIAPNTYLGLTSERRRMSLLQIDESIFIFAPARLSQPNLERMITQLLASYRIGAVVEPPSSLQDAFVA